MRIAFLPVPISARSLGYENSRRGLSCVLGRETEVVSDGEAEAHIREQLATFEEERTTWNSR